MVSSSYDINEKSWGGVAARIGALGLVLGSFGAAERAAAYQTNAEPPPATPVTDVDRAQAENPVYAPKFIQVRDVNEVVNRWSTNTHLYVSGNIGLRAEEITNLADALKTHPNWTVYLVEKSEGMHYVDADGKHFFHHEAVEHALGKEIRNTVEFSNLRASDSGLQNGNILYISFDTNRDFRKVGLLASQAYEDQGLGESHWQGNLDQLAIGPLKDGRRVYDAVMDTVNHLDSTREYRVAHPGVVKTSVKAVKENFGSIASAAAAVLAVGAAGLVTSARKNNIKRLKDEVLSYSGNFERYLSSGEATNKEFEAMVSGPKAKGVKGETAKLIADIRHYIKSSGELSEKGLTSSEALQKTIDPLTTAGKVKLFASKGKTDAVSNFIEGQSKSDSLVRLSTQIEEQQRITGECIEELKQSFEGIPKIKKGIANSLETLSAYAKDVKLSKNVGINYEEAKRLWADLKDRPTAEDPVSVLRELGRFSGSVAGACERAATEVERYEALCSQFESARQALKANTQRLKELEAKVTLDKSGKLEKLVEQNREQRKQLVEIRREIANPTDDSWLIRYAIYNSLFDDIERDQRAATKAHVSSSGTYYDSKPAPSYSSSSYSSSSYSSSSSSGFSSSSFGGGGFSGGGGSGFSSSSW